MPIKFDNTKFDNTKFDNFGKVVKFAQHVLSNLSAKKL